MRFGVVRRCPFASRARPDQDLSRPDLWNREFETLHLGDDVRPSHHETQPQTSRHAFDLPLDWQLSTGFRSTVLHHLPGIAYGHVASYAEVARMADNPKAVRAVGSACATNPLPVVISCHRVVRADGGLGGYLGGVEAKRALLDLEGAA
jgi:O-6-methylguanine DNA methyltransferase